MNKRLSLLLAFVLLIAGGCATVQKPDVEVVEATPAVSPTIIQSSQVRTLKRKVAIARFTNETKYGQGIFYDTKNDPIGKQAMDILSARLSSTDKFIMLERADLQRINEELKLGKLQELTVNADYLIVGSVSEFGRKEVSEVGVLSRTKKQVAYAKVNVRLVDVHTGQIIYSEEGDGEAFVEAGTVMGLGSRAAYDSTLNDKAISAAISKLVNNIVQNLLDKPWRAYILAQEGESYIVSGGKSQGLRFGDEMAVYKRGKRVKNPQTGMMIELPGSQIAVVRVDDLLGNTPADEVSMVSVTSGTIPVDAYSNCYIQELAQPAGSGRPGGNQ